MKAALVLPVALVVAPWTATGQEDPLSVAAAQAATQDGSAEDALALDGAERAFGLETQDYWVIAPQFTPRDGDIWRDDTALFYYADTGAGQELFVAKVELPAGAGVKGLQCFYYDIDAANDADIIFWKHTYDLDTNTPDVTPLVTVSSSGSGGYQRRTQLLDETVRYRDGQLTSFYTLIAYMPGSNQDVRFNGCRFSWNRQISDAPATASFDDVPTSHLFFQHIEALAASGITSGCGADGFCPNAPLTRGQMAAFLARALGLHWPY